MGVDGVDCMNAEDAPQQVVILLDSTLAQGNCPKPISSMIKDTDAVHAELFDSGIIITPPEVAGTKYTFTQMVICVDPKMSVPRWLVNLGVRNFCFLVLLQIKRAVAATRTPAHLHITTDPANPFYAFIRRRMGESLPTQLALAPPLAATYQGPEETHSNPSLWWRCCDCFPVQQPRIGDRLIQDPPRREERRSEQSASAAVQDVKVGDAKVVERSGLWLEWLEALTIGCLVWLLLELVCHHRTALQVLIIST